MIESKGGSEVKLESQNNQNNGHKTAVCVLFPTFFFLTPIKWLYAQIASPKP